MKKVYVLMHSSHFAYEGGDDSIEGVFARWEDAFKAVRKHIPTAERRKTKGEWEWRFPDEGGCYYHWLWLSVEKLR